SVFSFHPEATIHVQRHLDAVKKAGMMAGLVLIPATPLAHAEEVVRDLDLLLIMTVNPGFGGQSYLPGSNDKIQRAHALRRAPDFDAVQLPTGRPASIEDYRGKVVLLNVWATWCAPCKVEMPSMEHLHRKLAGTDFRLVAVSADEEDSTVVNKFVKDLGLTFE